MNGEKQYFQKKERASNSNELLKILKLWRLIPEEIVEVKGQVNQQSVKNNKNKKPANEIFEDALESVRFEAAFPVQDHSSRERYKMKICDYNPIAP